MVGDPRKMRYVSHLECSTCGDSYPADRVMNLCERDGRPVRMVLDLDRLRAERGLDGGWDPSRLDLWRFGGLLPLDVTEPGDRRHIVTLGEGPPRASSTATRGPTGSAAGSKSRTKGGHTLDLAPIPRSRSRTGAWR